MSSLPYPSLSLPKMLELIRKVVADGGYEPIGAERVVRAMGYNGLNGSAKSALGSARQYGLMLKEDEKFRVSKLGRRIVEPQDDEDAEAALRKAAGNPKVFALLRAHFGSPRVSTSEALPYLVGEGYSTWAVPRILAAYSDTTGVPGDDPVEGGSSGSVATAEGDPAIPSRATPNDPSHLFSYRLPSGGALVSISVVGEATTEAVVRVVNGWLEMTRLELTEGEGGGRPPAAKSGRPPHLGSD